MDTSSGASSPGREPEHVELPLRLKMRAVGPMWVALIAVPGNPDMLVGSIALGVVEKNPLRMEAFKQLMKDSLGDMIEHIIGRRPDMMEEKPANGGR